MFGMCLRYARCREDAEDMLHDGFIAVFKDIHQYQGSGPIEGWIRKVILNTALQHLRKQSKNIFIHQDEKDWQIEDEWNQQDQFDKEIMIQSMLDTLQYMPVGFSTVINLYIMEGYTHEQIASQLGISVGTSKSQLNRAKEHLRKSLLKTLKVNA